MLRDQMVQQLLSVIGTPQAPQIDLGTFQGAPQHAAPTAAPGAAGSGLGGLAGGMKAMALNPIPAPSGVEGPAMENGGFFSNPISVISSQAKGLPGLFTSIFGG